MSNKCLKSNLGDVTNQWSAWAQEKFRKKKKNKQKFRFQHLLKIKIGI